MLFGVEGYGRIGGGTRVLELAADSWEAALGTTLASSRQPCETFKSLPGARPEATQDGGGSQPEERHSLAAAALRITRRRRNPGTGGFWGNIPVPTIF